MTQKKKSIPLRVRFSLASTPEVANDIDSSIRLRAPLRDSVDTVNVGISTGGDKRPPHPLGACGGGGGVWVFILRIRSVFGVRDLVWGVIGLGMVRA